MNGFVRLDMLIVESTGNHFHHGFLFMCSFTDADTVIMGDVTYGACCVDGFHCQGSSMRPHGALWTQLFG